jgi:hypothetical protein
MSRILDVLWILVRIGGFWIAVSGLGRITRIGIRRFGYDAPAIFLGLISLLVLSVPLSLLGLFNRSVLSFILITGALLHLFYLFSRKRIPFNFKYPGFHTLILLLITVFIVITNTLRASEPQTNPDALTAYAVQPDRWLSSGRIYYIEESMFSGLPSVGEILAAWPASLSSSRTDQLSLLQVFQMCMLLFSAIAAWKILGMGRKGLLITVIACMATSMLNGWASLPKIEMTALYFSTVAMCLIYRGYIQRDGKFDPVPFLAMGLALGTKLTAYILLPSFLMLAYVIPIHRKLKIMFVWCVILTVIPLTFAVRTMIYTGAPFYPLSISFFSADEDHFLPEIPEMTLLARENAAPNDLLVNTEPEPLFVNVSELISSWGLPALLFLLGMFSLTMRGKLSSALIPLSAVLVYCLIASLVFNPLRWGAKYAFLMSPFLAAIGTRWTKNLVLPRISFYAFLIVMVLTSSLLPRFRYAITFPGMSSSLDFRPPNIVIVKALHDWCNTNLPEGSRLLSMWKRERYFSDHDVIVIENHPLGRRLFLADSLEEEMELLDLMDIDYVYYQTSDPMPGDLENSMNFLFSDQLEIISEVGGFTLCRINY